MGATTTLSAESLLRRLEWRVVRRLDGRLQGDYRTLFRGAGLDFTDLALDVLRHRLVLSYEAMSDEISADQILRRILTALPVPDVALRTR